MGERAAGYYWIRDRSAAPAVFVAYWVETASPWQMTSGHWLVCGTELQTWDEQIEVLGDRLEPPVPTLPAEPVP